MNHTVQDTGAGGISSRERRLQEARQLNLLSNTFMSVALNDIPACQHVLRILLHKPDLIVKEVRTQYRVSKVASRDAVLDVFSEDAAGRLYITEIQRSDTVDHPRRIRFYGAMADSEFLEKGNGYEKMPELYILYISEKDIWKRKVPVYHLEKALVRGGVTEERAGEKGILAERIPYEDGLHVMYVNAEIDDGSELAGLMRYFRESDPEDMSQGELSKRVHYLKEEEGGEEIMCEMSEKWWREGRQEGREDKAKETSIRLSRMGMPAEKIAEAVQYSVTLVQQWIGQAARS